MANFRPGPDPLFPYLGERDRFNFPDPAGLKEGEQVVAVGGNLSPGMLISAYSQGIFPWYNEGDPLLWQSPDPRLVIFPETLHVPSSMRKVLRRGFFEISFNRDFYAVITNCAKIYRPDQNGTWITDDVVSAYSELHKLGWAVCAEAWSEGELAGGCYGVKIGDVFCGESMFAKKPNASKAAFLSLAAELFRSGAAFIDCQIPSAHMENLGGVRLSRGDFLRLLKSRMAS